MHHPANRRIPGLFAIAALLATGWIVSAGDPCLIAFVRGGEVPSANPIAITECLVTDDGLLVITVGNVIVRLACLAVLMALFGFFMTERDPVPGKRALAGIAAAGTLCAFVGYLFSQVVLLPWITLNAFHLILGTGAVIAAAAAVLAGAFFAKPPVPK